MHFSLVTFTGEQDCVPVDRHAQRMGDRLPAIGNDREIMAFAPPTRSKPTGDLSDNRITVLGVRIVVRHNCEVCIPSGYPAHAKAPVLVPLADAAKDGDDATGR